MSSSIDKAGTILRVSIIQEHVTFFVYQCEPHTVISSQNRSSIDVIDRDSAYSARKIILSWYLSLGLFTKILSKDHAVYS